MISVAFKLTNRALSRCPTFFQKSWDQMKTSSMGLRLAQGAFWSLIGAVISRGLALLSFIIVARFLGQEGFGELGMIQSTIGMFQIFAGFGLGLTATKYVAEYREKDPEKVGRIIALSNLLAAVSGAIITFILFFLSPWLAANTLSAPHLSGLLRVGSMMLFLGALMAVQTGILSGFEAFRTIAKVNLWAGIANFPLVLIAVYLRGLTGVVWGLIAGMAVNCLLNHIAIRVETHKACVPVNYHDCGKEWGILWNFSIPTVLAGTLIGPINWICNAMLVNQPNGFTEMGVFNAANQWFGIFLFLPAVVSQASFPFLSERIGAKDIKRSLQVLLFSIKVNGAFVFPLLIVGSALSPYIMHLYGEGFGSSWFTLVVVLVTASLLAIQTPVGNIIAATGKMWLGLIMNLGWGIAFIILTWAFIGLGSLGLALARGIAYFIHATWTFGFIYYFWVKHRTSISVSD